MQEFSSEENKKIADFFYKALSARSNFRKTVLESLSDIFGYKRCTFWLANNTGKLVEPVYINIGDKIMQAWEDGYYHYDPFEYTNLPKHYRRQGALVVADLVDEAKYFDKNIYFNDILASRDYIHKMVLYLMDGEKFIGGLSFLRNRQEAPFTAEDKRLVSYLGHYMSQLLTDRRQLATLRDENTQLLEFVDLSGDGLIVADDKAGICYINAGAKNIYNKLLLQGELRSLDDLLCGVRYQGAKVPGSNHMTYCEVGGYGIHAKAKVLLQEKFYSIIFKRLAGCADELDQQSEALIAEAGLTLREKEVLRCVLKGLTNVEIAEELFVSIPTVKAHLYNIYHKCNVGSRSSLMAKFAGYHYR